jgi:site-specific recombinase XerD
MVELVRHDNTEIAAPVWARAAVDDAARWLHTSYESTATRTAYATALGIPRADQALWRGEPTHRNARELPQPTAFFPWCAQAGLDPYTGMTRDALKVWVTVQTNVGVSKSTQKARIGAVSAWYKEMRYRGHTTFEVPAALPRSERQNLGVSTPDPKHPTVPLTMPQVRALRVAADLDPGTMRLRNRAIVAALTTTGIRADELCRLTRADARRAGADGKPTLYIHGKGRKNRVVRLPSMALTLIEEYLEHRAATEISTEVARVGQVGQVGGKPLEQPVFVTTSGARLQPQHVTDMLRYLCRVPGKVKSPSSTIRTHALQLKAIAASIHPHAARHFYAITAEAHGVSVRQISLDLGHSSVAVTERYLEQGRQLAGSAAGIIADLITAGEDLVLIQSSDTTAPTGGSDALRRS